MCSGGGPTGVPFVDNAIDKADNWTEGAGEQLANIDPGPVIGDALADFDEAVIQQVDPGTIATAAAVVTQQYYLIPYIAAANTAVKGGSLEDIALSFGTAYIGAELAPMIGTEVGPSAVEFLGPTAGKIATSAITGATVGGVTGGITAGVRGKDILEGTTKGAVVGGVVGGVGGAVSEGYNLVKNEFGIGNTYTPDLQADADFAAAQAEAARVSGAGAEQIEMILKQEGMQPQAAADIARMTASGIGEQAVSQNLVGSYGANELYKPPPSTEYGIEKTGKKIATKAISGEILDSMYTPPPIPTTTLVQRRSAPYGTYSGEDEVTGSMDTDNKVALTSVAQSKYELRKFQNDAGKTTMISFKDDEPQAPIPEGYKEVETIGAAEGGLISTNMVKYSKKPLLAPRKKVTKPKKTASKGLASKL